MKNLSCLYLIFFLLLSSCTTEEPVKTNPEELFPCTLKIENDSFENIYRNILNFEKDLITDGYLSEGGKGYINIFEKMAKTRKTVVLGDYQVKGLTDRSPSILRCLISHYLDTHPEDFTDNGMKWLTFSLSMIEDEVLTRQNAVWVLGKHYLKVFEEEDFQQKGNKTLILLQFYFTSDLVDLPKLPPSTFKSANPEG